jgi:hypothetical protein
VTGLSYALPTEVDDTEMVAIPKVMWSDLLNVAYAMAGRTDGRLVIEAREYAHEGAQVAIERNEDGSIVVELTGKGAH